MRNYCISAGRYGRWRASEDIANRAPKPVRRARSTGSLGPVWAGFDDLLPLHGGDDVVENRGVGSAQGQQEFGASDPAIGSCGFAEAANDAFDDGSLG